MTTENLIDVPAGLKNVVVAETHIGGVEGAKGYYHYGKYNAIDLAKTRTFEEVVYFFLYQKFPDKVELIRFGIDLFHQSKYAENIIPSLKIFANPTGSPATLRGLSAGILALSVEHGMGQLWLRDMDVIIDDAIACIAIAPVVEAAIYRMNQGLDPVSPLESLSFAGNWIYMITGEIPPAEHIQAVQAYLIAVIDHGFNASTFTARIAASTGTDFASCISAALASLAGPLHGGAPEHALESIDEIGDPARTDAWVEEKLAHKDRIMGFGHAVYSTEDPRARLLRSIAMEVGGDLVNRAVEIEAKILENLQRLKPGKELHTNVEFWCSVVMELSGIPRCMFTPTFALARIVGWSAHIIEQNAARKLIRPSSRYTGELPES